MQRERELPDEVRGVRDASIAKVGIERDADPRALPEREGERPEEEPEKEQTEERAGESEPRLDALELPAARVVRGHRSPTRLHPVVAAVVIHRSVDVA
ncbi:MAG: hypothetical protein ABI134_03795 [Byssovorax sp.]